MAQLIMLIVVIAVGFTVYKEFSKSSKAKKEILENGKPGYLSVYRAYSEKGRDIEVLVNDESKGVLTKSGNRFLHIKLDGPCTVTTTKPGKFKSSFEITNEDLLKPVYAKAVGQKYSNDIVKINK